MLCCLGHAVNELPRGTHARQCLVDELVVLCTIVRREQHQQLIDQFGTRASSVRARQESLSYLGNVVRIIWLALQALTIAEQTLQCGRRLHVQCIISRLLGMHPDLRDPP